MPKKNTTPREYACIKACFFQGRQWEPGQKVRVVGEMPNKNFQLASISVVPPSNQAVSALNQTLQSQLRDFINLNGLDMEEELEKRGLNSVAAFPTVDAVELIDELRERYAEKQRQGPEVEPDVRVGEDEAGEEPAE